MNVSIFSGVPKLVTKKWIKIKLPEHELVTNNQNSLKVQDAVCANLYDL